MLFSLSFFSFHPFLIISQPWCRACLTFQQQCEKTWIVVWWTDNRKERIDGISSVHMNISWPMCEFLVKRVYLLWLISYNGQTIIFICCFLWSRLSSILLPASVILRYYWWYSSEKTCSFAYVWAFGWSSALETTVPNNWLETHFFKTVTFTSDRKFGPNIVNVE